MQLLGIPPSEPIRPRELACRFCRDRHYRCDNEYPTCGRCRRARIPCERAGPLRFRYFGKRQLFSNNQIWLSLPQDFEFVDETGEVIQYYLGHPVPEKYPDAAFDSADSYDATPMEPGYARLSADERPGLSSLDFDVMQTDDSPVDLLPQDPQGIADSFTPVEVANRLVPNASQHADHNDPRQEAQLLRHFVDNVSEFFDFMDSRRTFAIEVPQKARTNRTLFSAMLALSARHLSRVSDFCSWVSDQYYQECLHNLIPTLENDDSIADDCLLAATVILRLLEEMDGYWPETKSSSLDERRTGSIGCAHLLGSRALIDARPKGSYSALRYASTCAGLRQEIFTCLLHQQPTRLSLLCSSTQTFDEADDCTWAHRAVGNCSQAINFAFGDASSKERYRDLMEDNQAWIARRPSSFDPFFTDDCDDDENFPRFPTIRLHADWHVMAAQYNTLAHFMLVTHDPNTPKVGLGRRTALESIDKIARKDVRSLCGVALSNPNTKAASMVACMGISLGGDRFHNFEEQKQLMYTLQRTEEAQGWPTFGVGKALIDLWGWCDNTNEPEIRAFAAWTAGHGRRWD